MILFLRQIAFNIIFYANMILFCFILTPLTLLPRHIYIKCLNFYFWLSYQIEKYVLGLDYEVRGLENVPSGNKFIVAAKHQSMYETFKLNLLFNDSVIILKKELLYIPLWGLVAKGAGMIFVERGKSQGYISLKNGALKAKADGRPLVIYPQGTRVPLNSTPEQYPYKRGILRAYEITELPILPLATNSGVFWGKKDILKKPGKVVFEFLPVIPAGKDSDEVLKELSDKLECASNKLVAEEQNKTS